MGRNSSTAGYDVVYICINVRILRRSFLLPPLGKSKNNEIRNMYLHAKLHQRPCIIFRNVLFCTVTNYKKLTKPLIDGTKVLGRAWLLTQQQHSISEAGHLLHSLHDFVPCHGVK
jgi:hypothetical protein